MARGKRYRYNPDTKELELIHDGHISKQPDVFMPRDTIHSGHYFENLDCLVHSKAHKREVMKKQGVEEA